MNLPPMHMLKDRASGVETAKCGEQIKVRRDMPVRMTIWHRAVTCPACLATMTARPLTEAHGGA